MTSASSPNSSEPNPLDPIIAAYLEAVERGDKPDRDRLMLDHSQLASELRAFFADLDRVHQAAGKPADYDVTVIGMKEPSPGTILGGRYKLLENIGEGGMGSVWVAEQQQPVKRKVAIKLVKAGMDSKQVLARFEAERQALAVMDHPNIAKVFDGGMTDQGRPYFVMEYVKGIPFTEYCDRVKLSLKERLILFIPVCHAVQHAHHKGIVHRDLKPSNILICLYDGKPVPKVIDFGLAKAMHQPLTEKSIHTGHGIMVGTPVYMSPEQAEHNNLDVDTRTDIYSLGVVLYELLVGTTPLERQQLQKAAFDEILRLIKEVEPPRPSVRLSGSDTLPSIAAQRSIEPKDLRKSLTGDLDWIVMKSLEKERSRRYETANGFAQDIERFLNEEPVEACPPSRSYLLKKFVKKHRGQITAAGAVVLTLLLGVFTTTWFAIDARNSANNAAIATQEKEIEKQNALTAAREKEEQRQLAVDKAIQLERKSYHLSLQAAYRALHDGELDTARKMLLEVPKELRGWEWQYLNVESDASLSSVEIPDGTTIKAVSPEGAFALLEEKDKPVGSFSLMRAIDGEIVCHISLPKVQSVPAASISTDSRRIAFVGINQSDAKIGLESTLYVWDRDLRGVIWSRCSPKDTNGELFNAVNFQISASGQRVLVSSNRNESEFEQQWRKAQNEVMRVDDSFRLRSANRNRLFDVTDPSKTPQEIETPYDIINEDGSLAIKSNFNTDDSPVVYNTTNSALNINDLLTEIGVSSVALTGNPKTLAVYSRLIGGWRLMDTATGELSNSIRSVQYNPSDRFYASGNYGVGVVDNTLTLWSFERSHSEVRLGRVSSSCAVYIDESSNSLFIYAPKRVNRFPLLSRHQTAEFSGVDSEFCYADTETMRFLDNECVSALYPLPETSRLVLRNSTTMRPASVGISGLSFRAEENGTTFAGFSPYDCNLTIYDKKSSMPLQTLDLSASVPSWFSLHGFIRHVPTARIVLWGLTSFVGDDSAFVYDLQTGEILATFSLQSKPDSIMCFDGHRVWLTLQSRLQCFDIDTGRMMPLDQEIVGDAMSVSAAGDRLAVVSDDRVQTFTFPELRSVSQFTVAHGANSRIRWGLRDTRVVVSNENLMSLYEVATSEALLTLPKDNVLSAGLFYTPVPFRERWGEIHAVDEAESGPLVTLKTLALLRETIQKADCKIATFDETATNWHTEILADEKSTTADKICRLRLLDQVKRYFEQFQGVSFGSEKAFESEVEMLRSDKENAHFAELLLLIRSKWRPSVNALTDKAWELAATGNSSPKQYEVALELSTEAKALDWKAPNVLITLALANYRCGNFEAAIAESVEADRILAGTSESGSDSISQILIAMSQMRMGMADESRKKFNELKDRVASGAVKLEDVSRKLFEEAESLFAAPVPKE